MRWRFGNGGGDDEGVRTIDRHYRQGSTTEVIRLDLETDETERADLAVTTNAPPGVFGLREVGEGSFTPLTSSYATTWTKGSVGALPVELELEVNYPDDVEADWSIVPIWGLEGDIIPTP